MAERVAIGCGSAYAEDRIEPAVALADSGRVDYIAFDCRADSRPGPGTAPPGP